jgi:uncharacterized protein
MSVIESVDALRALYGPKRERSILKEIQSLDAHAKRFIAHSPFLVIASASDAAALDASPRGGAPGFVKVLDDTTLLIPDAPGNNRLDTLENIVETGEVGLIFFVPGMDETLRINGQAALDTDEALCNLCTDERRTPKLLIRVAIESVYLHCARALMRSELWNPAHHIDRALFPSMGAMIRDQAGDRAPADMVVETQQENVERMRQGL